MLLGKRVLGVEGAAAQREKEGVPTQGVTTVRLGKRLLGGAKSDSKPVAATANRVASSPASVPPEPPLSKAEKAAAKRAARAPKTASFTEAEVEAQLQDDPNVWDTIIDAESKRPEGPRVAVAALILAAADRAEKNPIPATILQELETIAAGPTTQ